MRSQSLHKINELLDVLEETTGESGDLNSTLQHLAQTAQTFFAADTCLIFAINPITNRFIASLTIAGDLREEKEPNEQPRLEELTQEVFRRGVLLVEDLEAMPEYQSWFTRSESILSFAAIALHMRHRKKTLGVLYLNFRQPQQFSSNDSELFELFADQASFILQEAWLLRRYQEVAYIGQEINHELATIDLLFQKLQEHIGSILDTSYFLLLAVHQPQTNKLDLYMQDEGRSIVRNDDPLEGACQYVIETQKTLFIRHLSKEAEQLPSQLVEIAGTRPVESLIFMPIVLHGISLGVLSMQHLQPNVYHQEDLFILQLLANDIALALHNVRLYNSLSQLNEIGQFLTQQIDSEQALQATADKIREATEADIVVLYPYEPAFQRFELPPRIAGTLWNSTSSRSTFFRQSDEVAVQTLRNMEPIFAKESSTIYTRLQGDVRNQHGSLEQREKIRSIAALPLRAGDEAVGVLFINFRQPQHFDAHQRLFIEGLAHYAAIAIKNARTFDTLIQRRVRELEILQHINRELSRTLDLQPVLNTLLQLAYEQVSTEEAAIWLYNPRTEVLESAASIGRHAEVRRKLRIPLQETKGIQRWVLEQKKPARVDNVHLDPQWRDLYIQIAPDTLSELDVPLLDGEEVIGVLNFESVREGAFRQEDEDFLLTLAGQAVLAIKNAQAYEREKRLATEGQVLNEISKEITSQLDTSHVFNLILEKALELTRSTTGALMLYDPENSNLWMAAERGVVMDMKGHRQGLDQGVEGYVAANKQLLNVDLSQAPWKDIYLEFFPGARSELAVPMLAGNDLRGVLNVESSLPNNFNERDERLLKGLADLAVVALQNAQAYEREKRLAAEGQVLNEISKEITSQLDLIPIFDLILEKALELTGSRLGSLYLFDSDLNDLWMAAERGVAEDKRGIRLSLDQGIVGYVASHKQLSNVKDVTQYPWKDIYLEFFPGVRSELAVPMLAGNDLRGVFSIESSLPSNFSESDERLLQGLADLAVVALQNAERYRKAEREAQRFELLYRAGRELGKITELEQLEQAYDVILQIAEEYSRCQVVIRRYDNDTQELVLVHASQYQYSPPFFQMKLDEGLNGQVAREQRTILVYDSKNPPPDVVPVKLSDSVTRSLLVTPIVFKDRYYGNLALSHETVGYFRGTDVNFYEGLTQQLASTIYRLETGQERQEFEQRALSAEEMSSIGQSAFEVTHRLGNDLGLVEFYISDIQSELRKKSLDSVFVFKKLEDIRQSVKAVLSFSGDLKQELAKLGAKEEVAGEPLILPPRVLLDEAMAASSVPPNIKICLEVDDDVAAVRVIHSLVADILRNLVINAIQAMPEGGKITLRARNLGRSVALEVADTGVGIPPQKLSQIFDLFFSTKGSSGFGLWSARRNALKNGGDLRVESKLGQGTIFTLLLPRIDGVKQ